MRMLQGFHLNVAKSRFGCCICLQWLWSVLQVLQTFVASVSCGCCKSRTRCCICCNGYTPMLFQMFQLIQTCSKYFSWFRRMLHVFYLCVAYVSHLCCKCFIRMLHMFSHICCICFAMATHVFFSCFRCMLQVFQLFRTYVANVSSRLCKSRSCVTHVIRRLLTESGLP